jgi:hypothetical protein
MRVDEILQGWFARTGALKDGEVMERRMIYQKPGNHCSGADGADLGSVLHRSGTKKTGKTVLKAQPREC